MNQENKKIIMIGILLIVVLFISFFIMKRNRSASVVRNNEGEILPTLEIIPTVDSSVIVNITPNKKKSEILLEIKNLPNETTMLEYELSYNTQGDIPKGTTASPIDVSNQRDFEKSITLGTCSSGTCVIDKVVGAIKVSIKFTGAYGNKIFEKEFPI